MAQIGYPESLNQAPVLRMQDKFAEFLGMVKHGIMEYRYTDAVHLYGHSCPTVVGVYLMVLKGLQTLYSTELPQRSGIEATVQGVRDGRTVGVTAAIAQLLTDTTPETGFDGIGPHGRFSRRNLLSFDADTDAVPTLHRKDNGKAVAASLNAGMYPFAPEMRKLIPKAVGGAAAPEEFERFDEFRQARVRAFLLDLADNP